MTSVAPAAAALPAAASIGAPRLLRGAEIAGVVGYARHLQTHGPLPRLGAEQLIGMTADVRLAGRGGAGFPVSHKLASLGRGRRLVVVNATESEPASLKDRLLIGRFPHLVLDGAALVADAVGARRVRVAVHGRGAQHGLRSEIAERPDAQRFAVDVVDGGYVAGEARALVSALSGGPPTPPGRRTLPSSHGVDGAPTFLSNAETFAQLATLARVGPAGFAGVGAADEPGTMLVTVTGAVARSAVLEVPIGIGLHAVLAFAGARSAAAVALGGYHGSWIAPELDLPLSRRAASAAGATLGCAAIAVLDDSTCALGELTRVASWLAFQSARQCGPCMFGLPAIAEDLAGLAYGRAGSEQRLARHAEVVIGRGACAHPDGASRFVTTGLAALGPEVQAHRRRGGCGRPVLGQLPLGPAPAR